MYRSPPSRSKLKRHGLRRPKAQISGRPPPGWRRRVRTGCWPGCRTLDRRPARPRRCAGSCRAARRVLAVLQRVAATAAVAQPDVQVAVRAEGQLPAVVVGERVGQREQDALAGRVGRLQVGRGGQLGDDRRAVAGSAVVDEEAPVGGEVGVEGQAQQPALAAGADAIARGRRTGGPQRAVGVDHADPPPRSFTKRRPLPSPADGHADRVARALRHQLQPQPIRTAVRAAGRSIPELARDRARTPRWATPRRLGRAGRRRAGGGQPEDQHEAPGQVTSSRGSDHGAETTPRHRHWLRASGRASLTLAAVDGSGRVLGDR